MTPLLYPLMMGLGFCLGPMTRGSLLPPSLRKIITFYFIVAIGAKGGASLSNSQTDLLEISLLFLTSLLFGGATPYIGSYFLKMTTHLDALHRAVIATHYGSVSLVTFATAASFMDEIPLKYNGIMVALVSLMELPAIFTGLYMAKKGDHTFFHNALIVIKNKTILTLLGSLLLSFLVASLGGKDIIELFLFPFHFVVLLFLLDLGAKIFDGRKELQRLSFPLMAFAIYMPLFSASVAFIVAHLLKLSQGDTALLMTIYASASYIAVPAIVQKVIPEAKEALYLPLVLGITFPFNILFGIELYTLVATYF